MQFFRGLTRKKQSSSSASAERLMEEQDYYVKNGSAVLEELLALCNGNCRIPLRYFSATEIENAMRHTESKMELSNMVTGSLNNGLVFIRFCLYSYSVHRDIAVTAQMSHLKNVLRLIGCCLEFEKPAMVYEYVKPITLADLLFNEGNINDHARKSLLSWGNRLRIANEVASSIVFLHTEFTTPIIHRDIKPANVIIDQNSGVAKILDFSVSISLPPGELEVELDHICGTYGYLAPEYALRSTITQKTDVYSFGVVLFELLSGKRVCNLVMDRVDSAISEAAIVSEEEAKSNNEEGNARDEVDSAISAETMHFGEDIIYSKLNRYIKEGNVMDIADPAILEEHGIEIRQQLEDYLDLVKKCTADDGDDRPYMIHVARELRRIEKCFRAIIALAQN